MKSPSPPLPKYLKDVLQSSSDANSDDYGPPGNMTSSDSSLGLSPIQDESSTDTNKSPKPTYPPNYSPSSYKPHIHAYMDELCSCYSRSSGDETVS